MQNPRMWTPTIVVSDFRHTGLSIQGISVYSGSQKLIPCGSWGKAVLSSFLKGWTWLLCDATQERAVGWMWLTLWALERRSEGSQPTGLCQGGLGKAWRETFLLLLPLCCLSGIPLLKLKWASGAAVLAHSMIWGPLLATVEPVSLGWANQHGSHRKKPGEAG